MAVEAPLPQAALPRWNALQRELVSRLADLGADPKARDASRVLRLVSTCNTKQPDPELRKVRVLWVEEADGEPLLHVFERLAEAVLPFTRNEAAAIEADKTAGRIIQFKGAASPSSKRGGSHSRRCIGTGWFWCRQPTGIGDNGLWRIRKLNGILYLPDVGSMTTLFSSAFRLVFSLQTELPGSGRDYS